VSVCRSTGLSTFVARATWTNPRADPLYAFFDLEGPKASSHVRYSPWAEVFASSSGAPSVPVFNNIGVKMQLRRFKSRRTTVKERCYGVPTNGLHETKHCQISSNPPSRNLISNHGRLSLGNVISVFWLFSLVQSSGHAQPTTHSTWTLTNCIQHRMPDSFATASIL
jgi:hypothetical protein